MSLYMTCARYIAVVGLQTYDPRGTSECTIHVYRCEVGENLACVSWIVREISLKPPTRRVEETCAEVPEPIPIIPAAYDDVFNGR